MIRPAKVEDITQIIALGAKLIEQSPHLPKHEPLKARKALAFFISGARSTVLVAEKNGVIRGFIVGLIDEYWWSESQFATDAAFYVEPGYRGFAVGLVKHLVKWSQRFPKVERVTLGVSSGLDSIERTGRLYQRLGFVQVGGIYTLESEQS